MVLSNRNKMVQSLSNATLTQSRGQHSKTHKPQLVSPMTIERLRNYAQTLDPSYRIKP